MANKLRKISGYKINTQKSVTLIDKNNELSKIDQESNPISNMYKN